MQIGCCQKTDICPISGYVFVCVCVCVCFFFNVKHRFKIELNVNLTNKHLQTSAKNGGGNFILTETFEINEQ